ncbi:MAG TPA: hypothetical protein GXX46_07660 [Peptococcaceae bacterium]|nr:hypothetical protein [Peptococcaceae bacterium]
MVIFQLALFFLMGYLFKVYFAYPEQNGQILNRLILNVTLPATIFLASSKASEFSQAFLLPIASLLIQLSLFGLFFLISRRLKLPSATECVFITAPLITNTLLFMVPFFYLAYGEEGLTRVILYDIGNAVTIYFVAHSIFKFSGSDKFNFGSSIKTILTSIPLWAFALGLFCAGLDLTVPQTIQEPLQVMREVNVFLPMFALGFYFRPALAKIRLVIFTILARSLFGLLIGLAISFFFANPMDKLTVLMGAAAPIGILSLVFSSEYAKDTDYASNIASYSLVLSLIVFTAIDYYFKYLGIITS